MFDLQAKNIYEVETYIDLSGECIADENHEKLSHRYRLTLTLPCVVCRSPNQTKNSNTLNQR